LLKKYCFVIVNTKPALVYKALAQWVADINSISEYDELSCVTAGHFWSEFSNKVNETVVMYNMFRE